MRIIGLTGSIACGKTTVSKYLQSQGYPVVDGDRISRELTAPGSPVLQDIFRAFGPEVFYEDATLNRRRLGRIVFSDPSSRAKLDGLMAPYLLSATQARIEQVRVQGAALCFLDMPLLFEKGYDRLCDSVWTVWLPEDLQRSRLMDRDGYSPEEADSRIKAVYSSDEKAARADRVIDNSGPIDQTYRFVSDLIREELRSSEETPLQKSPRRHSEARPETCVSLPRSQDMQSAPDIMKRPEGASKKHRERKSAWRMPFWLKTSLILLASVLLVGFTSLMLMNAYLFRCSEQHAAEQKSIDDHYPLLYRDLIEQYAGEYNLSPAFVSAVIRNESSFQTRAESGVGARGLMQLMPDTAEWIAGKLKVDGYAFERMYDAESNIQFGCWYLNYLSKTFLGDPVSVSAAYHAGQGQVKAWLSDPLLSEDGYSMDITSLPDGPTKNYAGRVIRDYGIYQEKYFSDDRLSDDTDNGSAVSDRAVLGNQ